MWCIQVHPGPFHTRPVHVGSKAVGQHVAEIVDPPFSGSEDTTKTMMSKIMRATLEVLELACSDAQDPETKCEKIRTYYSSFCRKFLESDCASAAEGLTESIPSDTSCDAEFLSRMMGIATFPGKIFRRPVKQSYPKLDEAEVDRSLSGSTPAASKASATKCVKGRAAKTAMASPGATVAKMSAGKRKKPTCTTRKAKSVGRRIKAQQSDSRISCKSAAAKVQTGKRTKPQKRDHPISRKTVTSTRSAGKRTKVQVPNATFTHPTQSLRKADSTLDRKRRKRNPRLSEKRSAHVKDTGSL
eukprot:m.1637715 g.1637715  ORF g.1637715 m.1637715 type:complete len:300 (-) comp26095_c0_seq1:90-989(-)